MRKFVIWRRGPAHSTKTSALAWRYLHLSPLSMILLSALSVLSLSAALFALYALFGSAGAEDSATAPEWKPPTLAIAPLDPPKPAEGDMEALSRPIFSKSRKPAVKNTAAISSNMVAATGALAVRAIILSKQTAKAFLLSSEAPDGVWFKIGDKIDAWTIIAIAPREVILQSGEQTSKLSLYTDSSSGAEASETAGRQPPQRHPQDAPSGETTAPVPKQ